jgi:hypothetical protein
MGINLKRGSPFSGWSKIGLWSKIFLAVSAIVSILVIISYSLWENGKMKWGIPTIDLLIYALLTFLISFLGSYIAGVLNSISVFSDITDSHWKNYQAITDVEIQEFLGKRSIFFFVRLSKNPIDDFSSADKQVIRSSEWDWQISFIHPSPPKNRWDHFRTLILTYINTSKNKPEIIRDLEASELSFRHIKQFEDLLSDLPDFFRRKNLITLSKIDFTTVKSILLSGVISMKHTESEPHFIHFEKLRNEIDNMRIDRLIINLASTTKNPHFTLETADEFGKYLLLKVLDAPKIPGVQDLFYSTDPAINQEIYGTENAQAILNLFDIEKSEFK